MFKRTLHLRGIRIFISFLIVRGLLSFGHLVGTFYSGGTHCTVHFISTCTTHCEFIYFQRLREHFTLGAFTYSFHFQHHPPHSRFTSGTASAMFGFTAGAEPVCRSLRSIHPPAPRSSARYKRPLRAVPPSSSSQHTR